MTLSDTYWDVDGTALDTWAKNISTLGGSRIGAGPLRGTDLVIPGRPGELWVPKVPGPRVLSLAMWVKGCNDDGSISADMAQHFIDNWQTLRRLFWRTDRLITLTKRWKGVDGVVHSAAAQAEFQSGLEPTMNGRGNAAFTVDLKLADPYFYGGVGVQVVTVAGLALTPGGDDVTRKITLQFSGAATLTNTTTGRAITVTGATTVDVLAWSATTIGAGGVTVTGQTKEPFWFSLLRDVNNLTLSAGTCTITYTPVFL